MQTQLKKRKYQRRKPGLSPLEEHRLRRRLRTSAPSESWVDAQIKTFDHTSRDRHPISYRFHDPSVFPPGGRRRTTMRWCRSCGRYTPSISTHLIERVNRSTNIIQNATIICDDCRIAADQERYQELYDAGLFLRPSGSASVIVRRELFADRRQQLNKNSPE